MVNFSTTKLLFASLLAGSKYPKFAEGNSFILDDERVLSKDIAPALGRGYSMATDQFHSLCLDVQETVEPSYDYHYLYTDVSAALQADSQTTISSQVKGSFGWGKIRASVEASGSVSGSSSSHIVAVTMRIERYYGSVKENSATLSSDALELLNRRDYTGFFKACGPNYVRSIRRAQEVTALFKFSSSNIRATAKMKSKIQAAVHGRKGSLSVSSSSSFERTSESLLIEITGYGLGLDKEGSDTLVATSLEEFQSAMKFAFTTMTRGNQGAAQTGMVYAIEFVPWTNNAAFQVANNLDGIDSYVYELPDESIPNADDEGACKATGHQPDSKEKCCRFSEQCPELPEKDGDGQEKCKDGSTPTDDCCQPKVCKIMQRLSKDQMKYNLEENGEFIARLDSIVRRKRNAIMTLQRCIIALKSFPDTMKKNYLETRDSILVPKKGESQNGGETMWVEKLRTILDPMDNSESVALLNMELDRFMQMYYIPCIAALHGQSVEISSDGVPSPEHFMMKSWREHEECYFESCLIPENSWNAVGGGCSTSLGYAENNKSETALGKIPDDLKPVKDCWGATTPLVHLDKYCSPRLSERKTTASDFTCPAQSRDDGRANEGLTDPVIDDDVAVLLV